MPGSFALLTRALFAALSVFTSFYCLLAYLPFTYQQVHKGELFGWLTVFVRLHPWLNLFATALIIATLVQQQRARRRPWDDSVRLLTTAFVFYQSATALSFLVYPLLSRLQNDSRSLVWSMISLLPVACVAAIDLAANVKQVNWQTSETPSGTLFLAAAGSSVFVTAIYGAIFWERHFEAGLRIVSADFVPFGWSVATHLVVFLAVFLILDWIGVSARLFQGSSRIEFLLCHSFAIVAIWTGFRFAVCPALGFDGWAADTYAAVLALAVSACHASLAVGLGIRKAGGGLALALQPILFGQVRTARSGYAGLAIIGIGALVLAVKTAPLDWNYLAQKITVVAIWATTFSCCFAIARRTPKLARHSLIFTAIALCAAGSYKAIEASVPDLDRAFESYAGYDVSFQVAHQLLAVPHAGADQTFYRFLARNTNISRSTKVAPVNIALAGDLTPSTSRKPHIFIVTVDSLRRDYLSPYNPSVTFTPAIAGFARESTVFEKAFTHYGGTGLSEPSIWAGSMLLHKQYVTPFAPMNSLEKLIAVDGYKTYISRDSILSAILTQSKSVEDLDRSRTTMNYDLCHSLEELAGKLDETSPSAAPIFAYTQPQNLHVSAIQREGASVPAGEKYPGFFAPYASRLKRLDGCFAGFVGKLKAKGIYDDSIVVLTSDHGDSLGEGGRWGHAYTLFPEIVRIPLIVHLPSWMQQRYASDPKVVAFSTDIAPTLYYLLGHRPMRKDELAGMALFTETPGERARDPRASYVVASSYAAAYGTVSEGGRRLYIADGVNYKDYLFDLTSDPPQQESVNMATKAAAQRKIGEVIRSMNTRYRYSGGEERSPR